MKIGEFTVPSSGSHFMARSVFLLVSLLWFFGCCQSPDTSREGNDTTAQQLTNEQDKDVTSSHLNAREVSRIEGILREVNPRIRQEVVSKYAASRNPEEELALWSKIADTYGHFTLNKHIEEYDKKLAIYEVILLWSDSAKRNVRKKFESDYLTENEVDEIFRYLNAL